MAGRTAETAKMVAELDLKTSKFTKGVGTAVGSMGKLSSSVAKSRAVAVGVGVGLERLAETGIRALSGAIETGIQGALTLEKAQAQTQAAIASTGGAAGVTAQQVRDLANAQEDLTTADDKTIQQGENLLLTFRAIGKDVFPQATAAMVNMAIALNKGDAATADFDSAALKLGKALSDPATGFTALKKAGVTFNDAQIKVLKGTKALTKEETKHYDKLRKTDKAAAERYKTTQLASKQLASQKLILGELNTEFGKAGAAAGKGFTADINRAKDAIEDAQITIAQGLMPALGEVARELATTFRDPAVTQGLKDLGTGIGDVIKGGVAFAKTVPWGTIASSLRTAAGFAKDLLNAFLGLPTWVQTAVITGWGLNKLSGGLLTDLASGLIKGVLGINAGVVNINAGAVNGAGVAGAAAAGGGLSTVSKVFLVGEAIGLALLVNDVRSGIEADTTKQATAVKAASDAQIAHSPSKAELITALGGVEDGIKKLESDPIGTALIASGALDQLKAIRANTLAALNDRQSPTGRDSTTQAETTRGIIDTSGTTKKVLRAVDESKKTLSSDLSDVGAKARAAGVAAAAAARAQGSSISQAIQANRPTVNVNVDVSATTVQQKTTVVTRYGPTGGDRNTSTGSTTGSSGGFGGR